MSKNRLILTIGIILVFLPFLGFPSTWEMVFSVILGAVLIFLSFAVSIKRRTFRPKFPRGEKTTNAEPFVDSHKEVNTAVLGDAEHSGNLDISPTNTPNTQ